jgi:hypothetical protein
VLENVIFGANNAIPTGDHNTVFGFNAGMNLTTGREMTIFGTGACASFNGSLNPTPPPENGLSTCIGSNAGNAMVSTGIFGSIDNVFVGQKAGAAVTAADSEVLIGAHAGIDISTGSYDTVIGGHSMDALSGVNARAITVVGGMALNGAGDKDHIVAVGMLAAEHLQESSQDVFLGSNSNAMLHAYKSVMIGDDAGTLGTSIDTSILMGYKAGLYAPSNAVVIGAYAGGYTTAPATFLGNQAGNHVSTGVDNVCVGASSCGNLSTGPDNVAIGTQAGNYLNGSESYTVSLGAGASTAGGVSNAAQIGLGQNATPNSLQFLQTQIVDTHGDLHAGTTAPGSTDPCTPGAVRVVMPYFYACVAPNQWMRATLTAY